jgi:hypothetical protein
MRSAVVVGFCTALVAFPTCVEAQSCHDSKLEAKEPTASLYAASPFLHGYRDGYQQGFHDADMEQQFGRREIAPTESEHFKKVAYRTEFGDRNSFVSGYRAGYQRGAADLLGGESFRVFDMFRQAESGSTTTVNHSVDFNAGVVEGYSSPRTRGAAASDLTPDCGEKVKSNGYCSGVVIGQALAAAERATPTAR